MTDTFPYRFVATEGMYAGTTFVYRGDGTVISYKTDFPTWYELAKRVPVGGPVYAGLWWPVTRHDLTAEQLARFEAIPLRASADTTERN